MMKKILLVGALVAASATASLASPITGTINLSGTQTNNLLTQTIAFAPGGSVGTGGTGTLGMLAACTGCVTFNGFAYGPMTPHTFVTPVQVFSAVSNGLTAGLSLNTINSITFDPASNVLTSFGTGIFSETGFDNTLGTITFLSTGQNTTAAFTVTGTSSVAPLPPAGPPTVAATPEPSSLVLLGTGLISSASALYRRRRRSIA